MEFLKQKCEEKPLEAICTGEAGKTIKNMLNFIKRKGTVRVVVDRRNDGEKEFELNGNDLAYVTSTETVKIRSHSNRGQFKEFLKYLGTCANPGHSFGVEVHFEEDGREHQQSYDIDGDGADHIDVD